VELRNPALRIAKPLPTIKKRNMKTLGIEIKGNTANFCAIEENNGSITEITGSFRKLELKNDEISDEVQNFTDTIHSFFDENHFNKIGIIKRSKSMNAKFPVSPISFKLEGLIQTYKDCDIRFVAPQTLRAYYKKKSFNFNPKYGYQKSAAELAYYLLTN